MQPSTTPLPCLPKRSAMPTGLALALALTSMGVGAIDANISQTPLVTASGTPVKPNLLFILDDSGSMSYDFLPEAAGFSSSRYGLVTAQCNGLAFNPSTTYGPPLDASGNPLANAPLSLAYVMQDTSDYHSIDVPSPLRVQTSGSLTMTLRSPLSDPTDKGSPVTLYARDDYSIYMTATVENWNPATKVLKVNVLSGYPSAGTTVPTPRVVNGYPTGQQYYKYKGAQPALGYTYNATGGVISTTDFYRECNSKFGVAPGSSVFTAATVTGATEAQNYANWKVYYSDRMKMMKTVVSQAFKSIDSKYRVGYATIWNKAYIEGADPSFTLSGNYYTKSTKDFLSIRDFDPTQKIKFYESLNAALEGGSTPLRASLSTAGRYYAKKLSSQSGSSATTGDPMQYSCQKNYTILATDGAWNEPDAEALGLDGSKVGNQDGTAPRPMQDGTGTPTGASSNSLADVTMHFYSTDLRTSELKNCTGSEGVDVCENTPANAGRGRDTAINQRMVTFTMSLGQNGTLPYRKDYETASTGTYAGLLTPAVQWPVPDTDARKVDDLWHAAVNGRGTFFNASDPTDVSNGLKTALDEIQSIIASGSAAATSTLRPVEGNNQVFIARYTSSKWEGDLRAYKIDTSTGRPNVITDPKDRDKDNADWSASAKLLARKDTRDIRFMSGSTLKSFTWGELSAAQKAFFSSRCDTAPKLSQCPALDSTEKSSANNGENLVNYIRGTEFAGVYRARTKKLGDMVGSSPVYVGNAPLKYTDTDYAAHQTAVYNRKPMVYVGGNDGMLHAFDAKTGEELWAFVPTLVMSNLYKLADENYSTNHQFFVDGSPVVADVTGSDGKWRTILVGGLGAGGAGYFALDVTDPSSPKALWEYSDSAKLGLSLAPALVTKIAGRSWSVVLSSGYNNSSGKGHVISFDAVGGPSVNLRVIDTDPYDAALATGLGPLNAWVENMSDNTALRFYAGDMQGRVWRFDPATGTSFQLALLKADGKEQPITTQPQLAQVNYKGFKTAVVYVGTGRLLGLSDVGNSDKQTIYGIRDDLSSSGLGDVRNNGVLVQQTLTTSGSTRVASGNPVDWTIKKGWYVDLPDAGERINIDMLLQFNTLTAASNIPKSVASCNSGGGTSWLYYFDIANGSNTGETVATAIGDSMVVGLSSFVLADGKNGVIVNKSVKDPDAKIIPTPAVPNPQGRRTSWRELADR